MTSIPKVYKFMFSVANYKLGLMKEILLGDNIGLIVCERKKIGLLST
jgi:hypothetical protein